MKSKLQLSILLLTLFLLCKEQANSQPTKRPNIIDSIQTAQQIQKLIPGIDKKYERFKVNDRLKFSDQQCQHLSDSLKIKPWTKADFDGNGLTDLLVIGSWYDPAILCILDKEDHLEVKPVTRRSFQECTFPLVTTHNNTTTIEYYFQTYPERNNWNKPKRLERKTLVYKFDDFIESNPNPGRHRIEKIEYSTTMCYGTCPVFEIKINADKTAAWNAKEYNEIGYKEVKGNFKTTVDDKHFKEIIDLLNYIDFEKLKNNYEVSWTDDQTSMLTITYDGGKIKSITDYGLIGTYGLDRAYQLFFELRENQKWTE